MGRTLRKSFRHTISPSNRVAILVLVLFSLFLSSCDNKIKGTFGNFFSGLNISVQQTTHTISEGSSATVVFILSEPSDKDITLQLRYPNGTNLLLDPDFISSPNSVTIPAGTFTGQIVYSTFDDTVFEGTETHHIEVSTASDNVDVEDDEIQIIINDNDTVPALSINDVTVDEDDGTATFTVTLTASISTNVTVDYTTAAGAAPAASNATDYTTTSGTLTILAGTTTETIVVPIIDDNSYELTENFVVNISNPVGATISDSQGAGTINDDETTPIVEWTTASQNFSEAGGTATVTAQISAVSSLSTDIPYTITGTATGGGGTNDYTSPSGTVTIPAGQTTADISIPVYNDSSGESSETVILTIGTPSYSTVGAQNVHTLTITDDDVTTVEFASASQSFSESSGINWSSSLLSWEKRIKLRFQVALSNSITNFPVLVVLNSTRINYADFKANGDDIRFTTATGTALKFEIESWNTSGNSYIWVKVPLITASSTTDSIYMYYKNAAATSGQDATNTWQDFKAVYHLDSANDATANATHGTNSGATFTTGLVGNGTNLSGSPNRINLPDSMFAANTSVTLSVWFKTTGSGIIYGQQNVAYNSAATSYAPLLYLGNDFKLRGGFWRASPAAQPTFVSSSTLNDNAWHHAALVSSTSGQELFLDGTSLGTASVAQSYASQIKNYIGLGYGSSWTQLSAGWTFFTGTLDEIRFSVQTRTADWIKAEYLSGSDTYIDYGVPESLNTSSITLTLNLSAPASGTTTVDYSLTGTATLSNDYLVSPSGTVTFTSGQSSATINVTILTQSVTEGNETIVLTLSNPVNLALGATTTHTITILDLSNTAPFAIADSATVLPDTTTSIYVLSNDTDSDGDGVVVDSVTQGTNGTVNNNTSYVTYTPNAGFTGSDSFTYVVSDGNGGTDTETVTVTIRSPFNWTGGGTNSNWNTAGNWYGGVVPSSSDIAYFSDSFCGAACNATINVSISTAGVALSPNYTGTISQAAGQTITIGSQGWTQNSGIFIGSDSNITFNGPMKLSGGSFTESSGTITGGTGWEVTGSPTYNASPTGTLVFNWSSGTGVIVPGNVNYGNVTLSGWGASHNFSAGTMTVTGLLTMGDTYSGSGGLYNGTILAKGNVNILNYGKRGGDALLIIGGSTNQTLDASSATAGHITNLQIASSGGTVSMLGTVIIFANYTFTSGTMNWGTSTLQFSPAATTSSIIPGTVNYGNVSFSGWAGTYNLNSETMNVGGTLTLKDTYNYSGTVNAGTIIAKGDVFIESYGLGGTAKLTIGGSGNQTVDCSGTVAGAYNVNTTEIASTGGTVSVVGTWGVKDFKYTIGNLSWGTSILKINASIATVSVEPGTITYGNVTLNGFAGSYNLNAATMTVGGTLTLTSSTNYSNQINNGTLDIQGDLSIPSNGYTGNAVLQFTGAGTQTINKAASTVTPTTTWVVNKTGGSIELAAALTMNTTQSVSILAGTINMNNFNWTNISTLGMAASTVINRGTGTLGYTTLSPALGTIN